MWAGRAAAHLNQQQILALSRHAGYVQDYLDVAYPTSVGQALDNAVAEFFTGHGTP